MSLAACCLVHGICCQWLVLCPTLLLIKELFNVLVSYHPVCKCVFAYFTKTLLSQQTLATV